MGPMDWKMAVESLRERGWGTRDVLRALEKMLDAPGAGLLEAARRSEGDDADETVIQALACVAETWWSPETGLARAVREAVRELGPREPLPRHLLEIEDIEHPDLGRDEPAPRPRRRR